MLPYLLIIILASVGLYLNGLLGLILGGVLGYFVSYFIGIILMKKAGGLVPYDERKVTAGEVIKEDWELVKKIYPGENQITAADLIAKDIEKVYEYSLDDNKVGEYWMSRQGIEKSFKYFYDQSNNSQKKEYYSLLKKVTLKVMYPVRMDA